MIRVICISTGYVESRRVGHTCFYAHKPFEDAETALDSLARDLLRVYQADSDETDIPEKEDFGFFIDALLSGIADDWPDEMQDWWPWLEMKDLLDVPKEQWYFLDDCWAEQKLAERLLNG